MTRQRSQRQRERGSMTLLMLGFMAIMMTVYWLAWNVGQREYVRLGLHNGADAAALGAAYLVVERGARANVASAASFAQSNSREPAQARVSGPTGGRGAELRVSVQVAGRYRAFGELTGASISDEELGATAAARVKQTFLPIRYIITPLEQTCIIPPLALPVDQPTVLRAFFSSGGVERPFLEYDYRRSYRLAAQQCFGARELAVRYDPTLVAP